MLMDLMDDGKISHFVVHCLQQILCKVDLPKAIETEMLNLKQLQKPICL